jgi:endosialidase-like protein
MRHGSALCVGAALVGLIVGTLGWTPADVEAAGESSFVGLTPCRLADTRGNGFAGAFGPPALATGAARDFPLQGQCGIPSSALAVALNVTATNTQGPGFLLLYPQGGAQPLVSTLNYVGGETVANAAIVPLSPGGLTVVAGVSGTDLILDVNGYFADSLVHAKEESLAVGSGVLVNNTGRGNAALGFNALASNATGEANTATGTRALFSNTGGSSNTAIGRDALGSNVTGDGNTAVGVDALGENTAGGGNIALGWGAGRATNGSGNILIGHPGVFGENLAMRLGTEPGPQPGPQLRLRTFIAGIRDALIGGDALPVYIDSAGQVGTDVPIASSRRVKTEVEDIGERSRRLHVLRPVTFHYRARPDGPLEYGLIAEEVAEVYPELVTRDAEGIPATVRYHLLPPLLLNELQRQERERERLERELDAERARRVELADVLAEVLARLARLEGRSPAAAGPGGETP